VLPWWQHSAATTALSGGDAAAYDVWARRLAMEVMTTTRTRQVCRTRRGARVAALWLAAGAALLAGCQTTPAPGREIQGDVVSVPRTRAELTQGASQASLHAAVNAGVTPADAAAQRLVLASCALPDPGSADGARPYTVTTLLPAGTRLAPDTRLVLRAPGDPFAGPRIHGRFAAVHAEFVAAVAAEAPLEPGSTVPRRLKPGDPIRQLVRCRPLAGPADQAAASFFRTVGEAELRYATAEAARVAGFTDAERSAGAAVRVRCALKLADGAEWHTPEFVARAPQGLALRQGEVVRLRAGADEGSLQAGPLSEVLGRVATSAARQTAKAVACRP
jgi:hypothetical protein